MLSFLSNMMKSGFYEFQVKQKKRLRYTPIFKIILYHIWPKNGQNYYGIFFVWFPLIFLCIRSIEKTIITLDIAEHRSKCYEFAGSALIPYFPQGS